MLDALGVEAGFTHAGSSEEIGLPFEQLPHRPSGWRRHRVLFLIRDPLDTLVSSYFQATRRSRVFSGSLGDYAADPRFGLEKILLFHLDWLEQGPGCRGFIALRYEDLKANTAEELSRAARFLKRRQPSPDAVAAAVAAGSFERMRALEASGEGRERFGVRLTPGDPQDPDSFKVRRGVIGGWRDYFDQQDLALARELLRKHDYERRVAAAGAACGDLTSHVSEGAATAGADGSK